MAGTHSSAAWHLSWFHGFAIGNGAAVNTCVHMSLWCVHLESIEQKPRSDRNGSHSGSIPMLLTVSALASIVTGLVCTLSSSVWSLPVHIFANICGYHSTLMRQSSNLHFYGAWPSWVSTFPCVYWALSFQLWRTAYFIVLLFEFLLFRFLSSLYMLENITPSSDEWMLKTFSHASLDELFPIDKWEWDHEINKLQSYFLSD